MLSTRIRRLHTSRGLVSSSTKHRVSQLLQLGLVEAGGGAQLEQGGEGEAGELQLRAHGVGHLGGEEVHWGQGQLSDEYIDIFFYYILNNYLSSKLQKSLKFSLPSMEESWSKKATAQTTFITRKKAWRLIVGMAKIKWFPHTFNYCIAAGHRSGFVWLDSLHRHWTMTLGRCCEVTLYLMPICVAGVMLRPGHLGHFNNNTFYPQPKRIHLVNNKS